MAIEKKYVETPLMKQYYQIKAVHPDAILLFRVGDFYETFGDDAIKASSILGITLKRRAGGFPTSRRRCLPTKAGTCWRACSYLRAVGGPQIG